MNLSDVLTLDLLRVALAARRALHELEKAVLIEEARLREAAR